MTRSGPHFKLGAIAVVCLAALWLVPGSGRTRAAGGPFVDAGSVQTSTAAVVADPTVKRSRYITINFDALSDPRSGPSLLREPNVPLELFPDVFVNAVFERFDPNTTGVTWVGRVDGVMASNVTLVYSAGLLTGSIAMPDGVYRIHPAPADVRIGRRVANRELHVVSEIDQSAFPREAPPIEVAPTAAQLAEAADVPMTDTADFIDVLVVYTAAAQAFAGGATGIQNLINLGVSETNTSYGNSAVNQRIRLAGTSLTSYLESGLFSPMLTDLRLGLGALNNVPAMRDALRADLVMLVVRPGSPDACGIGFLMTNVNVSFASSGFNVVDASCISPGYTFAHELGHNMGARHDWYVDSGTTPFTYAHGYVNANVGQRWRSIMAYPDNCSDQGFSCPRLLRWANPDSALNNFCPGNPLCSRLQYWNFPGTPMGIAGGTKSNCPTGNVSNTSCDADDHRALNNTALTVANLRQIVADKR